MNPSDTFVQMSLDEAKSYSATISHLNKEPADPIQRAVQNADAGWKARVMVVIRELCLTNRFIDADLVRMEMESFPETTHNLGAFAGLLKRAVALGYCRVAVTPCCHQTIRKESTIPSNHKREILVYQSLFYGQSL